MYHLTFIQVQCRGAKSSVDDLGPYTLTLTLTIIIIIVIIIIIFIIITIIIIIIIIIVRGAPDHSSPHAVTT